MSKRFETDMQDLVDSFKEKIKPVIEKTIQDFYCDITPYAEMDSLTNFRNALLEDIVSSKPSQWGYKQEEIRALILEKHKEEIVPLLNQDLLREVERLKSIIEDAKREHYSRY